MTEREVKTDSERLLAFVHQFADDIVYRRYVIRIDRVPQPEAIRDKAASSSG
jgi:hypothetical protein